MAAALCGSVFAVSEAHGAFCNALSSPPCTFVPRDAYKHCIEEEQARLRQPCVVPEHPSDRAPRLYLQGQPSAAPPRSGAGPDAPLNLGRHGFGV